MLKRLLPVLLLAACATSENVSERQTGPLRDTEAPDPSPLAGYAIPAGQCGMILWTRTGADIVPIFRSLDVIDATMTIDGETLPLRLLFQEGELRLGMRSQQVFQTLPDVDPEVTVEARLRWGQSFPSGSYIQGGTLALSGEDGWTRIVPVAGIAGCKA
ncbi:hypothetical protein [Parvularcula lutaonensis]|uniref:Lipoprotein n=1 Tax=Parvularcula lutaonensis TaxID=491923 RepID=A0ABV7MDA8_9PROT|nr:hypothetical protein [Parvularcula lutaonensis]GGY52767.1 hypothetical protein GCM10007148_22490 [Parvularcula lutaonensis]